MNLFLLSHELLVLILALGLLLVDLWLPLPAKRKLGYVAAAGVGLILLYSLFWVQIPAVLQALLLAGRPHRAARVGRIR